MGAGSTTTCGMLQRPRVVSPLDDPAVARPCMLCLAGNFRAARAQASCSVQEELLQSHRRPHSAKILVDDIVMPDWGVTRFMTQSDLAILTSNGEMERDGPQWGELLECTVLAA